MRERKGEIVGELRLGILPTVAPYLLPLFLKSFLQKYPGIRLKVTELTTEILVDRLKKNLLDAGLVVTPLDDPGIFEQPLFYEEFVVYVSPAETVYRKRYVLADDIDVRHLWLLEEGHCMRSQIMHFCELKSQMQEDNNFHYEAGSIETLKKMVEMQQWHHHSPRARAARPQRPAVEDGAALQSPCASAGSQSGDAPQLCEETDSGGATPGNPPGSTTGHAAQGPTYGSGAVNGCGQRVVRAA